MSDDELSAFLPASAERHIEDVVGTGIDEAVARSSTDSLLNAMFPDGRTTEDNVVFAIEEEGRPVGALWLGRNAEMPHRWAVWEIFLENEHRAHGLGTQAMLLAEDEVRSRGGTEMTLNVYAYNDVARHVYEKIGYEPTAMQMRKVL